MRPPHWDVIVVLLSLKSHPYEPLSISVVTGVTLERLFLVALANVNRVGEIQALSSRMCFGKDGSHFLSPLNLLLGQRRLLTEIFRLSTCPLSLMKLTSFFYALVE